jgi:hypothetical protein
MRPGKSEKGLSMRNHAITKRSRVSPSRRTISPWESPPSIARQAEPLGAKLRCAAANDPYFHRFILFDLVVLYLERGAQW